MSLGDGWCAEGDRGGLRLPIREVVNGVWEYPRYSGLATEGIGVKVLEACVREGCNEGK
jgi:hypothetical protein